MVISKSSPPSGVPPGLRLLHHLRGGRIFSFVSYQRSVLALTFLSYACFHAARKPPSIVKGVLHPDTSNSLIVHRGSHGGFLHSLQYPPPFESASGVKTNNLTELGSNFTNAERGNVNRTAGLTDGVLPKSVDPSGKNVSLNSSGGNNVSSSGENNVSSSGTNTVSNSGTNSSMMGGGLHTGWPPFSGKRGKELLGEMDVAFLLCYATGMYFAGHLGDRLDLRLFLSTGMIGSGIAVCLFGMAYFWNIHHMGFFIAFSMIGGLLQSSGWPSVVSIVARWYGKKRRGLILGIWNAHTSVGNICGSLLASFALRWGWGYAFLLPGSSIIITGIIVYLFLLPDPEIMSLSFTTTLDNNNNTNTNINGSSCDSEQENENSLVPTTDSNPTNSGDQLDQEGDDNLRLLGESKVVSGELLGNVREKGNDKAIGFLEAWRIPGVASFALCLFFAKLVAYTFLYWLPFYMGHEEIGGKFLSSSMAGVASTVFDVGGVVGGILAGHLSDTYQAQATVASVFMFLAIPFMGIYFVFGHLSLSVNLFFLSLIGLLVNGPYALITCAVSADLGQHSSLKGNSKALATVTAIIDGTGSVGAALGPFLTGLISDLGGDNGWAGVFLMLMISSLMAVLCLLQLVSGELYDHYQEWREKGRERPVETI